MNEWVVLLPTTYGMQERDEKIRTYLIGNIARACTIFNVNRIIIYRDPSDESSDFAGKFIRDVLEYANTTPYLRKYFPKKDTLKYAGVLPPLRAVHHPDINESIEYRYGYVGDSLDELMRTLPTTLQTDNNNIRRYDHDHS